MKKQLPFGLLAASLDPAIRDAAHKAGVTDEMIVKRRIHAQEGNMDLQEGSRTAMQVVTDTTSDRDKEIIVDDGWDWDDFMKAPQFFWGHDYSQPPLGSDDALMHDKLNRRWVAKQRYASTARAEEVWTLKREQHLKTASVGFVALERVERGGAGWGEVAKRLAQKWKLDNADFDGTNTITTRAYGLEHSDVGIAANPNALTLAVSKGLKLSADMADALGIDADVENDDGVDGKQSLPGSWEETREQLRDTLRQHLAANGIVVPDNGWAWITSMTDSFAIVEVQLPDSSESNYRITWTDSEEGAAWTGVPEAVDVTLSVAPKMNDVIAAKIIRPAKRLLRARIVPQPVNIAHLVQEAIETHRGRP